MKYMYIYIRYIIHGYIHIRIRSKTVEQKFQEHPVSFANSKKNIPTLKNQFI